MKYTITLFLIFLIVSLSFCSSFAFALPYSTKYQGLIEEVRITDATNNLHPVVQAGESAQIEVILSPPDLTASDVTFTGMQFNSCQNVEIEGAQKSKCTLALIPQTCTGVVKYQDVEQLVMFAIDGQKPHITQINVINTNYVDGKPIIGKADFTVSYTGITDTGECGGCAGVKILKIFRGGFADNQLLGTATFDIPNTNYCTIPDSQVIISGGNATISPGISEPGKIYAQVCDSIDHCSQDIVSTDVIIDTKEPYIEDVEIYDQNDGPVNYFNPNMQYKIKATIRDEYSIDENALTIDLSEFGVTASPVPQITDEEYLWTFQSSSPQPPAYFEISATDKAGNTKVHRKDLALVQDQSTPSLSGAHAIHTNHFYAGKSYIGKINNTLEIEIADSGSGISRNGVIIDLSRLNPAYSIQTFPDSCTLLSDGSYLCEKFNLDTNLNAGTADIKVTITDRSGNQLPVQTQTLYIDKTKPVLSSITQNMPLPTAADEGSFGFIVDVIEDNPIRVTADTSAFSDDGISEVVCVSSTNCLFSPADINPLSGQYKITIKVSDIAGNFVEKDYTFSLYQLAQCNAAGDGLVSVTVGTPNPAKLDRRLASYKPFRIYVPLDLIHDPNIVVGEIFTHSCANVPGISLGNYQIVDGDPDHPFFLVSASASTGTITDTFPLTCNLSLQLIHGETKCINLEEESFTVNIPLENFPLGDLGQEAQDKVQEVQNRIDHLKKRIKEKEDKLEWIDTWCKIVESIHYLDTAIQSVKAILFGLGCVLSKLPYVSELGKALWSLGCNLGTMVGEWVSVLIWSKHYLPTDEQSMKEIIGMGNKYLCIVYSCKLCNLDEVVKIIAGAAADVSRVGTSSDASKAEDKGTDDKSKDKPDAPATEESSRRDTMSEDWPGSEEWEDYGEWGDAEDVASDEWVDEEPVVEKKGPSVQYDFSKYKDGYSTATFFQDMSDATELGADYLDTSKYTWDPFKSVHYAKACFCDRGVVFSMRKERQIECIYRDCLKEHFQQGLPITSCEIARKEHECLYIDSAEYKLYGYFNWDQLWEGAVKALAGFVYNQAFETLCADYYKKTEKCKDTKDEPCQAWQEALCGVAQAVVEIGELYSVYTEAIDTWQPPEVDEGYC
ncbi:MAG: hypothetical protein KAT43_01745 [Nanoarchaeota archaeon]|nr:hypothetical protein [Nanoarchaeota archaeon]